MGNEAPDRTHVSRGCAKVALVLVGLVGLAVAGTVIATLLFLRSEDGQKVWQVSKAAMGAAWEGIGAPGTEELMAIGCDAALVMDLRTMMGEIAPEAPTGEASLLVFCRSPLLSAPPPIEQVVATYIGAVGQAPAPFMVSTQHGGTRAQQIAGPFDVHGMLMPGGKAP